MADHQTAPAQGSIALVIDMENFVRSALSIGLPINLEPVVKKVLEQGRIVVRRAYGDLDAACRSDQGLRRQMRDMLYRNLVQFEDIPSITQQKNTADMRMAVDTLSLAFTNPGITGFAIVSSDRDYVPLILKLRELGKQIIGIGAHRDAVNSVYVQSCDTFHYYANMFEMVQGTAPVLSESDDKALMESYLTLLQHATRVIVERGDRPLVARVAPLMRQLQPDFDPKMVNLSTVKDLIEVAEKRGLIGSMQYGSDVLITLPETTPAAPRPAAPIVVEAPNPGNIVTFYKNYFESKLKCPIPPHSVRERIYRAVVMIVNRGEAMEQMVELNALSIEVTKRMQVEGTLVQQASVFKMLYALFRKDVFKAEMSDIPYNPRVKGVSVGCELWDHLFIANSILVLSRDKPGWPLHADPLASVFDVESKVIGDILTEL